ncbi:MAG: hypothetical protein QXY28_04250 [Candidatus Nanoarchaeia archaeon]
MYIGVDSAFTTLSIVTNSSASFLGISSYAWASANIPLLIDGNAHSIVLNSQENTDYTSNDLEGISFNDGTLWYSAFALNGTNYIAVWLDPPSGSTLQLSGNGIYTLSQIVYNVSSLANSIQNALPELASIAGSIVSGATAGSKGGWEGALIGGVIGGVSNLITQGITAQTVGGIAPSTASQVQQIATKGYNAYLAAIKAAQAQQNSSSYQSSKTTTTGSSSDNASEMTLALVLALGVIAVIGVAVLKGRGN